MIDRLRGADAETTLVSQLRVERQGRRKAHRYNLVLPVIVALAATFLASDDARWLRGRVIVAVGGKPM